MLLTFALKIYAVAVSDRMEIIMQHSIGKTIKELRKSRGLTQEELAERIGVTAQAISKWENESGMPDLSQIVPLAHIFGVSADTLLGTGDVNKDEDVSEILARAQRKITFPLTVECLTEKYKILLDGLKVYPNNFDLIMQCMELEISLAYPSNKTYDEENARALYESCERHANTICAYDQNVNHVLRARMIMLMLHSAFGNLDEAKKQGERFPVRADFNIHNMYAIFAHWQKEYKIETRSLEHYIMNLLHALMHASVSLGAAYDKLGETEKAFGVYERTIGMLDALFKDEIKLPFHHVEGGDLYVLLAEKAMELGEMACALDSLEKAIGYDLGARQAFKERGYRTECPMLDQVADRVGDRYQNIKEIISKECFEPLYDSERFCELLEKIKKHYGAGFDMSFFDLFKKKKKEQPIEELQWNKMWDLWMDEEAVSPYAELMLYEAEVNNGGHDQFFENASNSEDDELPRIVETLCSILGDTLKANLQKAYKAFTELYDDEDALSEIYEECDNVFYDNEGEVEALLKEYARTMQV